MKKDLTILIPAHNEEAGLGDTLGPLLRQTEAPECVIVVDDWSSDRTNAIAHSWASRFHEAGIEYRALRPDENLGSKAKAQNFGLPYVTTTLVLPLDADTVLADSYVEEIKKPFEDERVSIAGGNVQSRFKTTTWEKGRTIEYLCGFHWQRPIQNKAKAPVVCSGCSSAFHAERLVASGGFPERTIVEDMDYTWTVQQRREKAVYVSSAEAHAADPETLGFLKKQLWRWMSGFFQNVRIHFPRLLWRKPVLALWVLLAVFEVVTAPLWWLSPLLGPWLLNKPFVTCLAVFVGAEVITTILPVLYATRRRRLPLLATLVLLPAIYPVKVINLYYAMKAMVTELVLVPLRLSDGLVVYEKGR